MSRTRGIRGDYTDRKCLDCSRNVSPGNRFRCESCAYKIDDLDKLYQVGPYHTKEDSEALRQHRWESDMGFVTMPEEPKVTYTKVFSDYAYSQEELQTILDGPAQAPPVPAKTRFEILVKERAGFRFDRHSGYVR